MKYTGTKFSQEQAEAIMSSARATSAAVRADMQRWKAEKKRRDGARYVTKDRVPTVHRGDDPAPAFLTEDFLNEDVLTRYRREAAEQEQQFARERRQEERERQQTQSQQVAPVPASDPELQIYIAPADWAANQGALEAAVGEVIASERRDFQQALAKRDRETEGLRREIKMLRDELGLERGLAALKSEVKQARAMQPSYEGKLKALQGEVDKLAKQTVRLRGQASQLEYGQSQLEKKQTHQRLAMTSIEVSTVGSATRAVLQRLRDSGVDFDDWTPSGLASRSVKHNAGELDAEFRRN